MTPAARRRYLLQVTLLMVAYLLLLRWLWPHARDAADVWLKVALSLSPLLPIAAVVALMARHVIASDELEQRVHLIGLGVATVVVGTASLVGGFLAMTRVWVTDGTVLYWVFPALCLVYGVTHMLVKRRYTGSWDCWG